MSTSSDGRRNYYAHLLACVTGIFVCLVVYSILQEQIMTQPYGEQGEVFTASLFLVLINRLVTLSAVILAQKAGGRSIRPAAPLSVYAGVSVSNVIATTCQYEALKHVSFPLQTLGKCAKMIPVMLWGTLISKKSYKGREYALAATITLGCSLFLTSGEVRAKRVGDGGSSPWGVLLMAAYLASDGFTSTFQARLFRRYQMSVYNQTLYTTIFSALFSLAGLVSSKQLWHALSFVRRHPESLRSILLLSAASTSGQLCIVHTIKHFGPLLFATVMTTRQFVSILLSCIVFAHPLSGGQWLGTALVFLAVSAKVAEGKKPAAAPMAPPKFGKRVELGGIAAPKAAASK